MSSRDAWRYRSGPRDGLLVWLGIAVARSRRGRQPNVAAFEAEKFGAALVRQRFLGGIEDLHDVTADAISSKLFDPCADVVERVEKIADEQSAGKSRQPRFRRQAIVQDGASMLAARVSAMRVVALRLAVGTVSPISATRSPLRTRSSARPE